MEKQITERKDLSFETLFWTFMVGSFAGFCVEVVIMFLRKGYLIIHQGLIYGPFIPIYGGGAVIMIIIFHYIKDKRPLTVFLLSTIFGGIIEYFCSYFQEIIFGSISWNYSKIPFNFDGRTSIYNAALLGIFGLVFIKHFYPWICKKIRPFVNETPRKVYNTITWVLVVFMSFNIIISSAAVYRQDERRRHIEATNSAQKFLDNHYSDTMLKQIYNNARPVNK